jgi:hypothetical protein
MWKEALTTMDYTLTAGEIKRNRTLLALQVNRGVSLAAMQRPIRARMFRVVTR